MELSIKEIWSIILGSNYQSKAPDLQYQDYWNYQRKRGYWNRTRNKVSKDCVIK